MAGSKKVAWVIGASSGIGEALCHEYSRRGYAVILSSRRESELQRVQKDLQNDESSILVYDLSHTEKAQEASQRALDFYGRIDVVHLNGGLSQRSGAAETSLEIDRKIMEVNFFGLIAVAKSLIPIFRKQGFGHYVVVSSLAGKFGFFLRSTYSASKHALHGFFESLRLEEERNGILVTMVCPTFVKTNISVNALNESGKESGEMDPKQDSGISPEECAKAIYKAQHLKKMEVVIGKRRIAVLLKRLAPGLLHKGLRKQSPR